MHRPALSHPTARDVATAAWLGTTALWGAERLVAHVQGVATHACAWSTHAALLGLHGAAMAAVLAVIAVASWVGRRSGRPLLAGAVAAVPAAALAALVGHALASGPWISRQPFAPVVAWGPAVAAAALAVVIARVGWWASRWVRLGLVVALVGVVVADGLVAVGHQPALHLAAYGVTATLLALVALREVTRRARRPPWATWIVLAIVGIGGPAGWLGMRPQTRAELLLRSAVAREVLRAIAPPSSRLEVELRDLGSRPDAVRSGAEHAPLVLPPGTSVVLVTIDALRADALPPVRAPGRTHAASGDTPHLDAFIASAAAFRRAYAPASFTMRSLPAVFTSRPAWEDPKALVATLPASMAASGRVPLAVVDRYFTEEPEGRALLQPFEVVEAHATEDMSQGVDQLLGLIDGVGGEPYFAWMHLMATHAPGYAGRPLTGRDGSWPRRYRSSVRWLDGELGRLLEGLRARGLHDRAIVVITSDHGEGLGDNGIALHGETVFEEEIRVPLAIRVPGQPGVVIDATVGLVDLAPTLLDLLGEPPDPRHVGRSRVPLMLDPSPRPTEDVHVMSRRDTYALVRGHDKLVYDAEADLMIRFDLASDPTEDVDLYGSAPELDASLVSAFVRANPGLFAGELDDPVTRGLLRERLRDVDPTTSVEALGFLYRACALADDPALVGAALERFASGSDPMRLEMVEHLGPLAPAAVGEALAAHLRALEGDAEEGRFVEALARRRAPPLATAHVAARLGWLVEHAEPDVWAPWLRLVRPWPGKPWERFGPPLLAAVTHPRIPDDALQDALAAGEGLTARGRARMRSFADAVVGRLAHPDAGVRAAACASLGVTAGPEVLPALRRALARAGEDIRVRQACLKAAVTAVGEPSVDLVIEQAADPLLTFYAVRLLERLHSPAAVPFLEATIAAQERGRIHAAATQALRRTREHHPP